MSDTKRPRVVSGLAIPVLRLSARFSTVRRAITCALEVSYVLAHSTVGTHFAFTQPLEKAVYPAHIL
jgi:hypothetical protein